MQYPDAARAPGYWLHPELNEFTARDCHTGRTVRVRRLSLSDCDLEGDFEVANDQGVELEVRYAGRAIRLAGIVAARRRNGQGAPVLTVEFELPEPEAGRPIAHLLTQLAQDNLSSPTSIPPLAFNEVPVAPERATRLLEALAASHPGGCTAHMRQAGAPVSLRMLPDRHRWPRCPFEVDVETPYRDYNFRVGAASVDGDRAVTVTYLDRPLTARVSAPPAAVVRFRHPLWPSLTVDRPLTHVSRDQVWFVPGAEDLLVPGMTVRDLELCWKGGSVSLRGEIVELPTPDDGQPARILLGAPPGPDWEVWLHEVDRLSHPNTYLGWPSVDELWELYAASGYFELSDKEAEEFRFRREAFGRASRKLSRCPQLGVHVCWGDMDGLEAAISMIKPWTHSWLVFQLGRHRDRPLRLSGNRVLYELYARAYEHVARDGDIRWHVAYVQRAGARFSKRIHRDFLGPYQADGRACRVPFHALECRTAGVYAPDASAVTMADRAQRDEVLAHLRETRPRAYVEALDLVPGRFELSSLRLRWRGSQMQRERVLWVVAGPRGVEAAAVLEAAEPGVHLFGLLDLCRLVVVQPDGARHFPALLEVARRWYGSLGRVKFVLFDEEFEDSLVALQGVDSLGVADLTVMAQSVVPDLLEEVLLVTAPVPAQSEEESTWNPRR